MEDNEDEPEDVRKATPVAGAVRSGSKDENAGSPKATGKKKDAVKPSRCDKNAKQPTPVKSEADCCRGRTAGTSKTPKTMSVLVYSPPCTLPKLEIIPRHCLSKQEYIDVLASPSRKCPPQCLGKTVIRKIRPISGRMNELAKPARRLIVSTLQERGETLPPEMVENLVKSIEGSACMTPEQAEKYFRDKEREKEKKGPKTTRRKCKGKLKIQCPSELDREAVMCQYLMAERFVKSIIRWKCPIPVEEFKDIASVILRRLSFVLEYSPSNEEDLKSQQMRFLADIIACWISGVLFEVAEEHKKEIEEEMQAQREEEEEEEDEEEDEGPEEDTREQIKPMEEDDDEDDGEGKKEDEGKEVVQVKKEPVETQEIGTQTEVSGPIGTNEGVSDLTVKPEPVDREAEDEIENARIEAERKRKQEEEEEEKARKEADEKREREMAENEAKLKAKLQEEIKKKEEEEEEKRKREQEEEEERRRKEQQQQQQQQEEEEKQKKRQKEEEEEKERLRKEAELQKKKEEEEEARLKELGPKDAIAGIGDGKLFKTDLPFVTFGKILDTVYKMVEDEPEGDETDLIHNRIQRALYEKLTNVVGLERPGELTENLKDVVDVLSGKIATWIKELLKETELNFLSSHPPEVESREIRDWGKWIDQVTDRADDWANWIHRVVKEAEDHKEKSADIKRGDWQSWTSETETSALLWRRYYLETVHQAHHNKMMLLERPVVKTGEKQIYSMAEEEIKNTDLGKS